MRFTEDQQKSFEEAARKLVQWLNENGHLHMTVIVDSIGAEVVEGLLAVKIEDYLKG